MDNQLTVGQRLDVYRATKPHWVRRGIITVGENYMGVKDGVSALNVIDNEGDKCFLPLSCFDPCGYYLKVKEVKNA